MEIKDGLFAEGHDTEKEPSLRMALTVVGKFAYRQEDGIFIVPIGCLKD